MTTSSAKGPRQHHQVVVAWTRADGQALAARCARALRSLGARLMSLGDQGGLLSPIAETAGWLAGFEAEATIRAAGLDFDGGTTPEQPTPVAMLALDPTAAHILARVRSRGGGSGALIGLADIRGRTSAWNAVDHLGVLAGQQATDDATSLIGPLVSEEVERAAQSNIEELREQFALNTAKCIVLAATAGLDESELSSLLFQLGLLAPDVRVLIDTGSDLSVADLLRRRAAEFGVQAELFGECEEKAALWAVPHVVVGVPQEALVRRVLFLRRPMVAIALNEEQRAVGRALEGLGLGNGTELSAVSAAVEVLSRRAASMVSAYESIPRDGQSRLEGLVNRCMTQPAQREYEMPETRSAPEPRKCQGPLERIGARPAADSADVPLERRQLAEAQVAEHAAQVQRWERRLGLAQGRGEEQLVREAERRIDAHRARMHAALQELAVTGTAAAPQNHIPEERFREMEVEAELARLKAKMGRGEE